MGIFQEEKKETFSEIKYDYLDFNFMVYLAPYNINTKEIGKVKLYKVNSKTRLIDFIKSTFPKEKRNILHIYNCVDSLEIDKYTIFYNIYRRHIVIQLLYCYEEEKIDKTKYNKIIPIYILELRDKYNLQIDLLLRNLQNKKELTKNYSID